MNSCPEPQKHQLEALGGMINDGLQVSCDILNSLLPDRLDSRLVATPGYTQVEQAFLDPGQDTQLCQVHLRFNGGITGTCVFSLARNHTRLLLEKLTSNDVPSGMLDTLDAGTFSEIGSVYLDGMMANLNQVLGFNLIYQVPAFRQGTGSGVMPSRLRDPWTILTTEMAISFQKLEIPARAFFYLEEGACHVLLDRVDDHTLRRV